MTILGIFKGGYDIGTILGIFNANSLKKSKMLFYMENILLENIFYMVKRCLTNWGIVVLDLDIKCVRH